MAVYIRFCIPGTSTSASVEFNHVKPPLVDISPITDPSGPYILKICVARCIHASESGNCTSRGIGTDVTCQMITKRFDPI